jgi:hypothetical protein
MKVYEVVRVVGLGDQGGPQQTLERTGFIYIDELSADKKANEMWLAETTEKDRTSGWCDINFSVREVEVITKKNRPTVYVDMDDTACDFTYQMRLYNTMYPNYQYPQSIIGFFSSMKPMFGFLDAWKTLSEHYDMRFLSRPSPYNLGSYTEKAVWVRDNMGGIDALEVLNLNPDKSIVGEVGDYLIDDWDIHGQTEFKGEFIHFGKQEGCRDWKEVTDYLLKKAGVL